MITITRTFEWDMGHRVPAHKSLCKNPHGHRYVMNLSITGDTRRTANDPEQDMVVDFGRLKNLVNEHVIDGLDHAFMYYNEDTIMKLFAHQNSELKMIEVPFVPTAESIANYLGSNITQVLKESMPETSVVSVEIFETPKSKAIWTPDA